MNAIDLERLGEVVLEPSGPVTAGQFGTWRLRYTVGAYGVDEGGTIKVAQRFASDWETPQLDDPASSGYTSVTTTGPAKLAVRYDPKGHERPWMKCLVIDVYDGSLVAGDVVTITLGDTSGGSRGIRAQTFQESTHEFRVLVDPTNACLVRRLPTSPEFQVEPGDAVVVVCIVPTVAQVGGPVEVFLRGEDEWGNPTDTPPGVELEWEGSCNARFDGLDLIFDAPGEGRVVASWKGDAFPSNPVTAKATLPPVRHFWGDLHAQSDATVGTGDEVEYFTFGRDRARLDFASHQGNDFQMTDEDWARLNEVVAEFNEEGRFVVFPGFEWSGNTGAGGDRNVFYLEEGLPIIRSSHWQVPSVPEGEFSPAHPVDCLFQRLRERVDPRAVLLGSHVGGRYAEIRRPEYFDEELGPLVEVASCWGVFEWLLWDAFDSGYVVGVMCNSDGHKGRPGAEGPGAGQFGIRGGLTCVLAEELSREAVFNALKRRHCYGTTGPRIALWFNAADQPMGSCLNVSGPVQLRARAVGTGPLEALQLYRGRDLVAETLPEAFREVRGSRRVRLVWGGSRIRGRGRRVTWDGTVQMEGSRILRAEPFAFDSPTDGITQSGDSILHFRSRTTGDVDGIDLWLDRGDQGALTFSSPVGDLSLELSQLGTAPIRRDLGGLDMHVSVQRYPEELRTRALDLHQTVSPEGDGFTPYFVRVIQADGHMAWSSPVYLKPE